MGVTQPEPPAQSLPAAPARIRNGLGVAALVIAVASLVAGISFVLFPLALIGGLLALIIGIVRSPAAGSGRLQTRARPRPA